MIGLNRVFLIGNVTALDFRSGPNGQERAALTLATPNARKVSGEWVENTDYHRLTAADPGVVATLRRLPEGCRTLAVEGSLRPRRWVDPDGLEHHDTQITLDRILFVSRQRGITEPTHIENEKE